MVEVLHSSYLVLFHHLPPVFWEPVDFPSYNLGSVKPQVLQAEVDEMLEKGFWSWSIIQVWVITSLVSYPESDRRI